VNSNHSSAESTERESSDALSSFRPVGRKTRRGWFEKTVEDITGTLESTVFAEEMAALPGLWQRVDPRSKIVAALALILTASLAHNLWTLILLYLLALLIAAAGRIPLAFFVKRVWLFLPFFTAMIALPAIFSFVTPGRPLWQISSQPDIAVTEQGVRTAAFLLLRVACSVSLAVILILTTRWGRLLTALRALHVPQVFVLIMGMTYRYIFLLLHTTNDMFLARRSRLVGRVAGHGERMWIANSMGSLLGKSYHLSDEVYLAMVSRGFRGEARALDPLRLQPADLVWMISGLLVPAAVIIFRG
jgi:cobalt/nickel transport system permease protein